ncbi:hypothetical protein PAP_04950 [Palaeococcus pacificus DY20341]|uniref:Nucleotide pyrophosphohydrolase n=1 Tax=Palaeococcus pacificus DY20341 TaxID=1343739 RepID=A0A075LTE7_9EURY|nr:nucleotide pyrophosphohydrolase [Palaeococcus pacificus]AIF69401.1 hypothetical protein PAP_04950 [Palaeococcus pacificus DY20341]
MSLKEIEKEIVAFRDARNWRKYHTPKNLAISIVVELGELLEHFQWEDNGEIIKKVQNPKVKEEISDEIADVMIYTILLAYELGIDVEEAIKRKIKKNAEKYPIKG